MKRRAISRMLRTGALAVTLVVALSACSAYSGPNYHIDTNGPTEGWLTIQGRATAQIASFYQSVGGNIDVVADNLANVKVPDSWSYEVCVLGFCQTIFTVRVKALWDNLLHTRRDQMSGNLYGILLIGSNIDTGGPCLRGIAGLDIPSHQLYASGWGNAGKLTDTCGGGEIFSND